MGPVALTAMGVAVIVGTGIYVLTGEAAAQYAGPAIALSFAIAGIAAFFTALSYAELATAVPTSGGTYSFAYVVLGPFLAWIIGWNLLIEYLMGAALIAVGWAGYATNALDGAGLGLPTALEGGPFDDPAGVVNVPALTVIALVGLLLARSVSGSARVDLALTIVKVGALILFIAAGLFFVEGTNYEPFIPPSDGFGEFGVTGVFRAAGVVFLAFIGFDVVATATREARNPSRTVPIAVVGSLMVATALYIGVSFVMVGLADFTTLDVPDPLSAALQPHRQLDWLRSLVNVAAIVGLAAGVLSLIYGQSRILMRMAADGMIPKRVARVNERRHTPQRAIALSVALAMGVAALVPLDVLAQLISAGTLLAFAFVSYSVLVLRRERPDLPRPFRIPGGPLVPILGIVTSGAVFLMLPPTTFVRLALWMVLGVGIFLAYSRRRSTQTLADAAAARAASES